MVSRGKRVSYGAYIEETPAELLDTFAYNTMLAPEINIEGHISTVDKK